MIACVIHGAKELKIENRPEPLLPQDGEVLVRFSHEEFRWAVDVLVHGRIDIEPILTGEFSLPDADRAFASASDRSKAMKISLVVNA